jgi:hypothetical protein
MEEVGGPSTIAAGILVAQWCAAARQAPEISVLTLGAGTPPTRTDGDDLWPTRGAAQPIWRARVACECSRWKKGRNIDYDRALYSGKILSDPCFGSNTMIIHNLVKGNGSVRTAFKMV